MPVPVVMPQLGESVVEGTISKWHKSEREAVKKDDPLVDITTDKVNIEVPSPENGVLAKILVAEGETVPVGAKLAIIAMPGEEVSENDMKIGKEELKPRVVDEPEKVTEAIAMEKMAKKRYSPAVRRLAKEYGIDPDIIQGTGIGGRVSKEDVIAYIDKRAEAVVMEEVAQIDPGLWATISKIKEEKKEEMLPLSALRKAIAKQMIRSTREAPHVTTWDEADMTRLVDFLDKRKEEISGRYDIHLTYMPFFIKAAVFALKEYPVLNSSLMEDEIKVKKYYNIGIAVDTQEGLIVPVIHSADKKGLIEIGKEIAELARKARSGKLSLQDVHEGTFTITNAGAFGAVASTPIINYPEVAILGVHSIMERPVVKDGLIVKRWMVNLCLSFDHRVVDGVPAVRFLHRIKEYLEEPELWLLEVL